MELLICIFMFTIALLWGIVHWGAVTKGVDAYPPHPMFMRILSLIMCAYSLAASLVNLVAYLIGCHS